MCVGPTVASLALLALAGCATTQPTSPTAGTLNSATASVEPTTTPAQWASVIAPLRASWTRDNIKWVASGCDAGDARDGITGCISLLRSMQNDVDTMHTTVKAMADPTARTGYLGDPPNEVAKAYKDLDAAVRGAYQYVPFKCPAKKCAENALMFGLGWDMIGDALTAWEPWL